MGQQDQPSLLEILCLCVSCPFSWGRLKVDIWRRHLPPSSVACSFFVGEQELWGLVQVGKAGQALG